MEYYRHADWLGSAWLTSTPSRTVSGGVAYAPFGETYAESGGPDASFTGQNPDTNANLYDFMYREYGIQGRWPSPDPLGPGAFNLADPQSLDLYAYVRNNPTGLIDPLGLFNLPSLEQLLQESGGIQAGSIQFGSDWNEFGLSQIPVTSGGLVWGQPATLLSGANPSYFSNGYGNWEESLIFLGQGFQLGVASLGNGFDLFGEGPGTTNLPSPGGSGTPWWGRWIHKVPANITFILPVVGIAGPAVTITYLPQTHNVCVAPGLGASLGRNVSQGP